MSINDLPTRDDREGPFHRAGFLAAFAFLVLVLILGVTVVVTHSSGKSDKAAPAPSTGTTQPTASSSPNNGNACGLSDVDQTVPAAPPSNVSWKIYDTVALPYSTTDGPGIVDGDVARCYAHTPTGALIAAAQIPVRYLVANDWQAVVNEQVMPGVGRAAYSKMRAQVTTNTNQPGDYGQIAGFQFITYSANTAVVEIVSRFTNGNLQMVSTTLEWSGEDWKLQLQDSGGVSPNAQQVPNLTGFISWGGV